MDFREFKVKLFHFVFSSFLVVFLLLLSTSLWAQNHEIDRLEKELKSHSMLERHAAAEKLSQMRGPRVEEIFLRLVQRSSVEWKRVGLMGLASVAPQRQTSLFVEHLEHNSFLVRWAAVIGLGNTGDAKWIPKLKKLAKSDPGELSSQKRFPVREAAKQAIQRIESSPHWLFSFAQARALAEKEKKSLVLFWGLPGERWSLKMERKGFEGGVYSELKEKFIWVKLDAVLNESLADTFLIKEIPTTQLMDSKGIELERWTGYYSAKVLSEDLKAILSGASTTYDLVKKLQEDPDNIKTAWILAKRFDQNNQLEKAALLWEKVVNLAGSADKIKKEKALFSLGYYRGSVGQYSKAIPLLKQFVREFSDSKKVFKARYCLALSYLGKGQKRKALDTLKRLSSEPISKTLKQSIDQVVKKIKESR